MSPRRNVRRGSVPPRQPDAEFDAERARRGAEAAQVWTDGEWIVRSVPAGAKAYRCPGCDHEIRPGVPHLVAWPADGRGDATDRRHWHGGCWRARERRAPNVVRSRSAPRYG